MSRKGSKPVEDWSVSDVSDWLDATNLSLYKIVFQENDIDGQTLLAIDEGDADELVKPFHIRKFLKQLDELRQIRDYLTWEENANGKKGSSKERVSKTKKTYTREGWLGKRSDGLLTRYQKRFFKLTSGELFFYTKDPSKSKNSTVTPKGFVPLNSIIFVAEQKASGQDFEFKLWSESRSYSLTARNDTDRDAWISAIRNSLSKFHNMNSSGNDSTPSETPLEFTPPGSISPGLLGRPPYNLNKEREAELRGLADTLQISPFVCHSTSLECVGITHDIPREVRRLSGLVDDLRLDAWAQEAIRFSLLKGHMHKMLVKKAKDHNSSIRETYLRVDVYGKEVQSPCLLEIWPGQHYSPVHEHSKSYGIIRGVIGRVDVMLFDSMKGEPNALSTVKKDTTAWMSPNLYQVHQVFCPMAETDYAATFHIYSKTEDDYFRYIDGKGEPHRFLTKSDITWIKLSEILKAEGGYSISES